MVAPVALTSHLARSPAASSRQTRVYLSAGVSVVLMALALVAVTTLDGSAKIVATESGAGVTDPTVATITNADVDLAKSEVVAHLNQQPTQIAAHVRGSVDTSESEAIAIMSGNGPEGEADMARYNGIDGSHSSAPQVADQIINDVEETTTDVTGKAGALTYANLLDANSSEDPNDTRGAWLRGSLPNYRAEANYIESGVHGNFEKSLENGPTMSVVGGATPPRDVAYRIIDAAEEDVTSPDCTGSTDADGEHGVGKGTPPCTAMTSFAKDDAPVDSTSSSSSDSGDSPP
jgi:hypothetical protein